MNSNHTNQNSAARAAEQDDIIQRLRDNADIDEAEHGNARVVLLEREAADEIERLRGELYQVRAAVADERVAQAAPGCQYHILKTDPEVFQAVLSGAKTFEIRLNDRGYAVGDVLGLRETKHTGAQMRAGAPLEYTGRECQRFVSHVLTGYGLADGWCCLSFRLPHAAGESTPVAREAFMYGIMRPDGKAHFEEFCVSGDRTELQTEVVNHLNRDNPEDGTYSVVALFRDAAPQASEAVPLLARALAEWHEDDGPVTWWAWCGHEWAGEAPWYGTPLDQNWPGYHTHWTPIPGVPVALSAPQPSAEQMREALQKSFDMGKFYGSLPEIDPENVRNAALEEAAQAAMNAPITADMLDSDDAKAVSFHASARIRALKQPQPGQGERDANKA